MDWCKLMCKLLPVLLILVFGAKAFAFTNPFGKEDYKSQEIKYQYGVLKDDLKYKRDNKILNRTPSGYMTVEEYERASEYKEKSELEIDIPKIDKPSDFMYIPKPIYTIVKYNSPIGGAELSLGRRLYAKRQINAQGIVAPDYSKLVYPAVYYYTDSGSVGADLFVIPLQSEGSNLEKILSANVAKRNPEPILSTDKNIDNYAAFRTLTPVDFSQDGTWLLVKEKIGSSEDGIWQTNIYVYDFSTNASYDLSVVREAISYFWKEYMKLNLNAKRWDIYPLGFDTENSDRVIVQAYAYTGSQPINLGTWSIDAHGIQSRLVSFDKNYSPNISTNGFKIIKEGVEEYQNVKTQEKLDKAQEKVLQKQLKAADNEVLKQINEEFKYKLKDLNADQKDELRDNLYLQKLKGSTEDTKALEEAYEKYRQDQLNKDIEKTKKIIDKQQQKIDKLENKIQSVTDQNQAIIDSVKGNSQNNSQTSTIQNDTEDNNTKTKNENSEN